MSPSIKRARTPIIEGADESATEGSHDGAISEKIISSDSQHEFIAGECSSLLITLLNPCQIN